MAKEGRNLYLTELERVVNNIMKKSFPSIVEADFTANMESLLDMVEEGKVGWKTVVSNFYPDLDDAVKKAESELEKVKIEDEEVTDVVCEQCGRHMVIKYDLMESSWHVRDFRNAGIRNRIWKRSVCPVLNAEKILF